MYFRLPDGQTVHIDAAFVVGDNQYARGWLRQATPAQRDELGIVELPPLPPYNDRFFFAPDLPRPLDDVKRMLKDDLKQIKWQKADGGITLLGARIATDDTSRTSLIGVRIRAKENANYTVNWKADTGFVTLTAAQIVAVADAVADHVQACFDREMVLAAEIDAAVDIHAALSIDLSAGWPA